MLNQSLNFKGLQNDIDSKNIIKNLNPQIVIPYYMERTGNFKVPPVFPPVKISKNAHFFC